MTELEVAWDAGYRQGWYECEEYLHQLGVIRAPLPPAPGGNGTAGSSPDDERPP